MYVLAVHCRAVYTKIFIILPISDLVVTTRLNSTRGQPINSSSIILRCSETILTIIALLQLPLFMSILLLSFELVWPTSFVLHNIDLVSQLTCSILVV
jgi:hypothetical protein